MEYMKRFFITLCLLFFTFAAFAEKITMISFNMGGKSRTVPQVAQMILDSRADVAFLQEIWVKAPQNKALREMTTLLGESEWDFAVTSSYMLTEITTVGEETYKSGNNGQNNAIIYNRKKLSLTDLADEIGFTRFSGEFLFDKNHVQLVRLSLQTAPEKQIVAINVHLPYTDKAHRARDLATLERLYARYKLRFGVIIAGDFNYQRKILTTRNFDFVDGTERWFSDRNYGIATTISTKGEGYVLFANDYDHFVFSPKITVIEEMHRALSAGREKHCPRIQFGQTVYTSSTEFRKEVSDHVPIVMAVEM